MRLEVGEAVLAGEHGVVAEVFVLRARVGGDGGLKDVPEAGVIVRPLRHLVEPGALGVGIVDAGEAAVAPLDRVDVVGAEVRGELRHVVAGLRDVVEAGVVHDRRRRAVRRGVGRRAEGVHGDRARRVEVVVEPQCVAYLVGGDEPDQLAHLGVTERHLLRVRVRGRRLHEVPVPQQVHDVVEPADVGLQDLAAARVVDVRAIRVLHGAGEIADDGVAGVLGIELGVLLRRRRVFGEDGVLEAGRLERPLPVLDALLEVGPPLLRRRRVDVIDDGVDGLDEFAARVGLGVRRFEPPAKDVLPFLGALRLPAIVGLFEIEEADALIEEARLHRDGGQEHHRVRHLERDRAGAALRRRLGRVVREHAADLDVFGVACGPIEEAPLVVEPPHFVLLARALGQPERRHVRRVQLRHVDHDPHRIFRERLDREARDDGLEVRVAHGLGDGQRVGGDVLVGDGAEEHVLPLPLPPDGLRVRLLSPVADVVGRPRDAGDEQHLAAHQAVRDLEEQLRAVVQHMDREEPGVGPRRVGDDLVVRLEVVVIVVALLFRRVGLGDLGRPRATDERGAENENEEQSEAGRVHERSV